jgi:tetratricopeptide (TPR) repeat protein
MIAQWQSPIADSIERDLKALEPGEPQYLEKKAGIMGTLLQTVKYSDPKKALKLCDDLGAVFMQLNDSVHAYEAMFRYKSGIYELTGEYDNMLMNLEAYAQALSGIHKQDGYVYLDIGNVYFGFGMYDLAKENYRVAEEIFLKDENLHGICTIYNNRAQIHMAGENNDSALVWLRKSHAVRKYQLKDEILAHESMYLMAKVFRDKKQYDSAEVCLRLVIADFKSPQLRAHTDHIALHKELGGA